MGLSMKYSIGGGREVVIFYDGLVGSIPVHFLMPLAASSGRFVQSTAAASLAASPDWHGSVIRIRRVPGRHRQLLPEGMRQMRGWQLPTALQREPDMFVLQDGRRQHLTASEQCPLAS